MPEVARGPSCLGVGIGVYALGDCGEGFGGAEEKLEK